MLGPMMHVSSLSITGTKVHVNIPDGVTWSSIDLDASKELDIRHACACLTSQAKWVQSILHLPMAGLLPCSREPCRGCAVPCALVHVGIYAM